MAQAHNKIRSPALLAIVCGVAVILLFSSPAKGAAVDSTESSKAASAEDDLIDAKDTSPLDGTCTAESCTEHCKQRKHAVGRCDKDQCVCKDLKQKGRCGPGGCGMGLLSNNNNNNNNNIVLGR